MCYNLNTVNLKNARIITTAPSQSGVVMSKMLTAQAMEPLIASLLILAVTAVFSPLGIGAGIVYVPILHYGIGLDFATEAVPFSLCLVWISSISCHLAHQNVGDSERYDINGGVARVAVPAAGLGSLIAVLITNQIHAGVETILKVGALFFTFWYLKFSIARLLEDGTERPWATDETSVSDAVPSSVPLALGANVGGAAAALLGVSGAIVHTSVLRNLGQSEKSVPSPSFIIVIVTVPIAIIAHILMSDPSNYTLWWIHNLAGLFPVIALISWSSTRWSLHRHLPAFVNGASILIILLVLVNYSLDIFTLAFDSPNLVDVLSFSQLIVAILVVGPILLHQVWCNKAIKQGLPELPKGELPSLTIVIPTWNEGLIIEGKLNSLSQQVYPRDRLEVIIIDSASEDKTVAKARAWLDANQDALSSSVRIIEEEERRGKSFSINHAFSESSSDVVMMSDVDCRLDDGTLERLARWFLDSTIGAVTGHQILIDETGSTQIDQEVVYRDAFSRFRHGESCMDSTPIFHGECSAYRASAIEGSPLIEGANADDSQMAVYVRRQGLRTIWDPDLIFREVAPPDGHAQQVQKVRRAQGLARHFARNSDLWFSRKQGVFGRIMGVEGWMHVITPWLVVGGFILGFASIISFTLDGGADTSLLALFMLTVDGVVLLLLLSARIGLPLPLARTASAFGSYMWILFKAQILLIRRTSLHRWEQVTAVRERLAHLDTIQR